MTDLDPDRIVTLAGLVLLLLGSLNWLRHTGSLAWAGVSIAAALGALLISRSVLAHNYKVQH